MQHVDGAGHRVTRLYLTVSLQEQPRGSIHLGLGLRLAFTGFSELGGFSWPPLGRAMLGVDVTLTYVVACWFILLPEAFVSPGPNPRPMSIDYGPGRWQSIVRRNNVPYVGHSSSCGK